MSLKYGKGGYRKQIDKILKEEDLKKFFLELGEGISGILGATGAKGVQWRSINYAIKKKKREKPF
ncbi:hypothetical protein HYT59_02145 [Candidatus Woesebacteria bacterium]|nr:hypothetical protein [Candidatus Woesebacteria bacterium]